MTALRQLSVVYVAAAGAYAIAMAMSAHPAWVKGAKDVATYLGAHGAATAAAFDDHVLQPDFNLAEAAGRSLGHRIALAFAPAHVAHRVVLAQAHPAKRPTAQTQAPPTPDESSADNARPAPSALPAAPPPADVAALRGSENAPAMANTTPSAPSRAMTLAPPIPTATASLPPQGAPGAGEIIRVEERLKASLTAEMLANFGLFLYVSKADAGPWAQRMYVFQKQPNGDLNLLYDWPVSTGREALELDSAGQKMMTDTPPGYYELDPHRAYEHYRSTEWGQPMPYAMFFNWVKDGNETGLAIHAASGDDVAKLGHRASAGCIHLAEDNARTLFTLIRTNYKGLAPRFAIDRRTGTMSNEGILLHDASGRLRMAAGYKVLVFIEDYGGENVVAAIF